MKRLIAALDVATLITLVISACMAGRGMREEQVTGAPGGTMLRVVRHETCLSPETDDHCRRWYRPLEDPLGQMFFLISQDGRACVVDQATFVVADDLGFRCLRWRWPH